MSWLDAAEVEGLMATGIDPDVVQDVIDREEDWLANDPLVGIGQLAGERTQLIWVEPGDADPLLLQRPTDAFGGGGSGDSLLVLDGGLERTDAVLTGPARIERRGGGWRGPTVEVTYTPTDELRVKRALLELVRLTLTASPYRQEATEGHSYSRPQELQAMREELARSLHPHRGPLTTRLGTATWASHRVTRP